MLDIQFIVPAEHGPYHGEVTVVDRLTYAAAAHLGSVATLPGRAILPVEVILPVKMILPVKASRLVADQVHHFQFHAAPVQQSMELFGIGVALSPAPKVPSDHDTADGGAAKQLVDELFPRKLLKLSEKSTTIR